MKDLKPGKQLDRLIAEMVMSGKHAPYSSDVSHAHSVAHRYETATGGNYHSYGYSSKRAYFAFYPKEMGSWEEAKPKGFIGSDPDTWTYQRDGVFWAIGENWEHAICLAALKVAEYERRHDD